MNPIPLTLTATLTLTTALALALTTNPCHAQPEPTPKPTDTTDPVTQLTALIEAAPDNAILYHRRGVAHFFNANPAAAVADFDRYLARQPDQAPHHWQRGIALYYAKRYADATRQFQDHDRVNPRDVENATWLFLCQTRSESLEAARENLIPYRGDQRVPMREIHALFAGSASEQDVLDAATANQPTPEQQRNQLCYAHLYLALYHEALNQPKKALHHISKAANDYRMDHYMGKVAQVHAQLATSSSTTQNGSP